jgi:hypothetical protein
VAINFLRIDKGIRFVPQSSPPTSPQEGDAYYDSTLDAFRVYDGSSWITVDGDEANTASNVGTGSQVFKQKTGANLEFRSLVAGTNISINQGANDITIAASGGELNFLQLANVSWNGENGTAGFAKNTSGQVIPTDAVTTLVNWTVVSNTHAIFNPTTGVLTVNRAGFIDLVFSASFQNNGNGVRSCHAYKNNTEFVGVNDVTPYSGSSVSTKAIVLAYPVK